MAWSQGRVKLYDILVNKWIWGLLSPCCKIDLIFHICWCYASAAEVSREEEHRPPGTTLTWFGVTDGKRLKWKNKSTNHHFPFRKKIYGFVLNLEIRSHIKAVQQNEEAIYECTEDRSIWSAFIQLDWKCRVNMPKTCIVNKQCARLVTNCLWEFRGIEK